MAQLCNDNDNEEDRDDQMTKKLMIGPRVPRIIAGTVRYLSSVGIRNPNNIYGDAVFFRKYHRGGHYAIFLLYSRQKGSWRKTIEKPILSAC